MHDFKEQLIRNLIILAGAILLFVIFFYLIRLNIIHESDAINSLRSKKMSLLNTTEELSYLVKEQQVAQKYQTSVSDLIPTRDNLVILSKDLQKLAKSRNLIFDFNYGKERDAQAQGLNSISFSFSLEGSIGTINEFLKDIESKYFSIKISNLNIESSDKFGNKVSVSGDILFFENKNQTSNL
jgi:hypothetical protein